MCGIVGILSQNKQDISHDHIRNAVSCLRHRGPQGNGTWISPSGQLALGHSRLSIIDLSEAASQPMHYGERYTIIHNGELYNYTEIRTVLQQSGYHFHSASDTEVIVAAYDKWKEQCLQKFDGMFAFAIWDEKEKKLFAARDRFGEKPFYFFYDGNKLLFASEMKALWNMGVPKEVNRRMLYNFLTIGYTSNPADPRESFYQNILQLPAASFLVYELEKNELSVEKYWQVYIEHTKNISVGEAVEKFNSIFEASVKKRLRSDVPVGTSLSGGLDSAAIVAFCDQVASGSYIHQCFTVAFSGFHKDETQFARLVAKKYGLKHHIVEIKENEIVSLMKKVMNSQEMPFSTASVLAQYQVYEAAKLNGVTVLLDGQGADELLGGYHKYYKWYWSELYRRKQLRSSGELVAARANGVTEKFGLKEKLASLLPEFTGGLLQGRKTRQAFHHPGIDRDFASENKPEIYHTLPASFDLNGILYFNSFVNGLDELLRLADRNSMAHGVEVRLPFLNHELAEFLFTLPPQFKIQKGWTKWLLRKSVEAKLPGEITWRKDKTGFEPPQEEWMKTKDVEESIMEGKKKLVKNKILLPAVLKKNQPHSSYAAGGMDWKYWSASFLFKD